MMEIRTERLIIRGVSQSEARQVKERANHSTGMEALDRHSEEEVKAIFSNQEQVQAFLDSIIESLGDCESVTYGAWRNHNLIGVIAVVNDCHGTPELEIYMLPEYQGQGYGFEFLRALLKELFLEKKYRFFQYRVSNDNSASINLVKKLGGIVQPPRTELEKILMQVYRITPESIK